MNQELIKQASQSLAIQAVYLRSSQIRCKENFLPPWFQTDFALTPQLRYGATGKLRFIVPEQTATDDAPRLVLFYFATGVRLIDDAALTAADQESTIPDEAVYLEIECEFCAHYQLAPTADIEALGPALEEFGRYNLAYHVWPYWREYVQSVSVRMAIPPIPIPMYRVPAPDRSEK